MNAKVLETLQHQANHEMFAANAYLAMAYWCESMDYTGFAAFFYQQAAEENEHAEKINKHILDRSALPKVSSLDAPKGEFESLVEIAETALGLEEANTRGITAVYEVALEAKDYPAQFLMQWFIEEQVEEETWANSMVEKTKRAQSYGDIHYLDNHILEEMGVSPKAEAE